MSDLQTHQLTNHSLCLIKHFRLTAAYATSTFLASNFDNLYQMQVELKVWVDSRKNSRSYFLKELNFTDSYSLSVKMKTSQSLPDVCVILYNLSYANCKKLLCSQFN